MTMTLKEFVAEFHAELGRSLPTGMRYGGDPAEREDAFAWFSNAWHEVLAVLPESGDVSADAQELIRCLESVSDALAAVQNIVES